MVTKMQGDRDDVDDVDSDAGRTMRDGVEVEAAASARCRTGGGGGVQPARAPHDPLRGSPSHAPDLAAAAGGSVIATVDAVVIISTSSESSSGVVFSPLKRTVPRVDVG